MTSVIFSILFASRILGDMLRDSATKDGRMAKNLADFLEVLTSARTRVLASGQPLTDIPEEVKVALIRLLSE